MTIVTVLYALLFYTATAILLGGLGYKIYLYARTPQPLKIPTTPAPTTHAGVAWRMFKEIVVFESLFKANRWIWFFGWLFHFALFLALFHHLNVFFGSFGLLIPLSTYAGVMMVFGLSGLWLRRFLVDRLRYITAPSDHLMLALLMAIVLTGLAMSPWVDAAVPVLPVVFGGRQSARTVHFLATFAFLGFTAMHLFMVAVTGVLNNVRAIVTGWSRVTAGDGRDEYGQGD